MGRPARPQSSKPTIASKIVADEEYFRAAKLHKQYNQKDQEQKKNQELVESFIRSKANPDPKLLLKVEENKEIVLPRETLYLIDKIIRKRVKEGPLQLEHADSLLQELKRKKDKHSHRNDYQARLEQEKKALESLRTPAKKKSKRPTSAYRQQLHSAPNNKFESKLTASKRHAYSEKKHRDFEQLSFSGVPFTAWKKQKEIEQSLKDFLIQSCKDEILSQIASSSQQVKQTQKTGEDVWKAWRAKADEQIRINRKQVLWGLCNRI